MTKKLINRTLILTLLLMVLKMLIWFVRELPIMRQSYLDSENGMHNTAEELYRVEWKNNNRIVHPPSLAMDKYDPIIYWLIKLIFITTSVIIIGQLCFCYFNNDFDNFFEKYTDPPLTKFCNWVHRRNNNEEECK